jgi:hypothetical protein
VRRGATAECEAILTFYGPLRHDASGLTDNRIDPDAYSTALDNYGWHTYFDSAGAGWTPTRQWTVISQWMSGDTCVGPTPDCYEFSSASLLGSWQLGSNRLSARFDGFQMHSQGGPYPNRNRGHAWTFAYQREFNTHFSVALEELRVDSSLCGREHLGEPEFLAENQLQLAFLAQL